MVYVKACSPPINRVSLCLLMTKRDEELGYLQFYVSDGSITSSSKFKLSGASFLWHSSPKEHDCVITERLLAQIYQTIFSGYIFDTFHVQMVVVNK